MVGLGTRLPGSPAHDRFVEHLDRGFRAAGLEVQRDRHQFTRWTAHDRSLVLIDGALAGPAPVASYYSYSGRTEPDGIVRPLVYAGPVVLPSFGGNPLDLVTTEAALDRFRRELTASVSASLAGVPGGVSGQIVLMEAPVAPLTMAALLPLTTYTHDPAGTMRPYDDYKRVWTTLLTLPTLEAFKEAGAAGVVFALDASIENTLGQYTPFIHEYQDLPALIVDRGTGDRLRSAAQTRPRVRFTLNATLDEGATSDSLVAVLPGRGETLENVIVHTHTDGQNFAEENGGIAALALAQRHAARPRSERPRDLVFSCVTGHFAAELPETEGFIADHPDLVENAVASLTLEHMGCREWLDDARGYYATGRSEFGAIFHSNTAIGAIGVETVRQADLRRTSLLRAAGTFFFGVGADLHGHGIPSLAFIGGPNYLLADQGRSGHLDKFSAAQMRSETLWADAVVGRLTTTPAELLRLGDSTLLGAVAR